MRIAVVTETWSPSVDGVVVRLEHTVRALREAGHEVLVIAPTVGSGILGVQEQRTRGISLWFVYGGRRWALPDRRVNRWLREFEPDVVHVVNPVLMGSVAAWHATGRHAVAVSYHTDVAAYAGHYHLGWLRRPLRAVMRRTYRRAAVRLATAELGRRQLAEIGIGDVELWSRGVDRELFRPDRDGRAMRGRLCPHRAEPLALYVGRLAAEKGCERLLPLAQADPPVHVAFVGDGPDRKRLERLFAGTHATFAGVLRGEELAQAYVAADVFVFPSGTDTLGLVLLEAMACRVPVVATDTPAGRQTLQGYPRHRLVDGADDGALVHAVRAAADAPRCTDETPHEAGLGNGWRAATDQLLDAYRTAQRTARASGTRHSVRIGRFAAVGASNVVLDLAVFNLLVLTHPTRSAWLLVAYNTVAVLAALANSYVWNSRWTFGDRPPARPAHRWRQRLLFALQGGLNLAVNDVAVLGTSLVLISLLGAPTAIAANASKVVAMLTASLVSYLLMHLVVFPTPREDGRGPSIQSHPECPDPE